MPMGAYPVPHRVHWLHRWFTWVIVGLLAAVGISVGIDRAFLSGQARYSWPPEPCVVQGIDARCGTSFVPENRTKPNGRTIGLNVVVLPAFSKPARKDAVTYLAGAGRGTRRPSSRRRGASNCRRSTCIATSCSSTSGGRGDRNPTMSTRRSTGRGWRWTTWMRCGLRSATGSST